QVQQELTDRCEFLRIQRPVFGLGQAHQTGAVTVESHFKVFQHQASHGNCPFVNGLELSAPASGLKSSMPFWELGPQASALFASEEEYVSTGRNFPEKCAAPV